MDGEILNIDWYCESSLEAIDESSKMDFDIAFKKLIAKIRGREINKADVQKSIDKLEEAIKKDEEQLAKLKANRNKEVTKGLVKSFCEGAMLGLISYGIGVATGNIAVAVGVGYAASVAVGASNGLKVNVQYLTKNIANAKELIKEYKKYQSSLKESADLTLDMNW